MAPAAAAEGLESHLDLRPHRCSDLEPGQYLDLRSQWCLDLEFGREWMAPLFETFQPSVQRRTNWLHFLQKTIGARTRSLATSALTLMGLKSDYIYVMKYSISFSKFSSIFYDILWYLMNRKYCMSIRKYLQILQIQSKYDCIFITVYSLSLEIFIDMRKTKKFLHFLSTPFAPPPLSPPFTPPLLLHEILRMSTYSMGMECVQLFFPLINS